MGSAADLLEKERARKVTAGGSAPASAPEDPEEEKKWGFGAEVPGGKGGGGSSTTKAPQDSNSPEDLQRLIALIQQRRTLMGR